MENTAGPDNVAPEYRDPAIDLIPAPITPDNPPWTSGAAFGVWVVSVILILFLPNLFLLPYLRSQNISFTDSQRLLEFLQSDPTAVLISLMAIIPAHVLTFVLAWVLVTRFKRFDFRKTLGWSFGGMKWWHFPALIIVFFAIAAVLGHFIPEEENQLLRILRSSRTAVYLLAFLATVTAPVVEEAIYRGVLYSAFQRTFGVPLAVIAVTLLFSLVHVPQYYPSVLTIVLLTLLSLILTLVRVRTRNLLPCIVLHFLFNGIQSLVLVVEPFIEQQKSEVPEVSGLLLQLFK